MQEEPDVTAYNRLVIWLFLREKKYRLALRQQIALDKRGLNEELMIMELARIAGRNEGYGDALQAYDYLIAKGDATPYFLMAKLNRVNLRYDQFENHAAGALPVAELKGRFEDILREFGFKAGTCSLFLNYAHLLAFDLQQPDKATDILIRGMELGQLDPFEKDKLKAELADVRVFSGDVWDAILLYSQVIGNNKDNELGDQVKMKKARLGYYMGEMSWAKAQLDVLKASTSKLIANDAMQLSLFIGNNMNLDTTSVPLQLFAEADLLLFRRQNDAAWAMLDSLQHAYPFHTLQDDIFYRKASIREQQGNWTDAAYWLGQIVSEYPYDLLADDALLELGNLYRNKLSDPEKAKSYYLKLLEDHPGSVHVEQARIYFRELRGDFDRVQDELIPVKETIN
jgi:tetratricopeptide (TPR) repeat protein